MAPAVRERPSIHRRRSFARLGVALALCAGCTGEPVAGPTAAPSSKDSPPPIGIEKTLALPVVVSETGPTAQSDRTFLDGMRLAVEELNGDGGLLGETLELDVRDDGGDAAREGELVAEALGGPALFVVGSGDGVTARRRDIEEANVPVFVLGGDLYTARRLFRQTFQTSPALVWQARVLARYLVVDRGYERIEAVLGGASIEAQRRAVRDAFREEGVDRRKGFPLQRVLAEPGVLGDAQGVLFLGSAEEAGDLAQALATLPDPPQLALGADALSPAFAGAATPGTVASYPYTWSGWAEPIPRVRDFRARIASADGFAQEGYDAVHLLADALERSGGETGDALIAVLESFRSRTYSALPIRLGPDDHTLIDDSQLGLFAVPSAEEEIESWLADPPQWRPVMRTFTYDGEKTNILDIDKQIFFPGWKKPRPSPKYFRAVYGITTRYGKDPLH